MSSAAASERFSADLLLPPTGDPSLVSPNLQARENGAVASDGDPSEAQAFLDDLSAHLGTFGDFFKNRFLKLLGERDEALAELALTKTDLDAALAREGALETELAEVRQVQGETQRSLETRTQELADARGQQESLEASLTAAEVEAGNLRDQLAAVEGDNGRLNARVTDLETAVSNANAEITNLSTAVAEIPTLEFTINDLNERMEAANEREEGLEAQLALAADRERALSSSLADSNQRATVAETQREDFRLQVQTLQSDLETSQSNLDRSKRSHEDDATDWAILEQEQDQAIEGLQTDVLTLTETNQRLSSSLSSEKYRHKKTRASRDAMKDQNRISTAGLQNAHRLVTRVANRTQELLNQISALNEAAADPDPVNPND